jgi:hypothetical protein
MQNWFDKESTAGCITVLVYPVAVILRLIHGIVGVYGACGRDMSSRGAGDDRTLIAVFSYIRAGFTPAG